MSKRMLYLLFVLLIGACNENEIAVDAETFCQCRRVNQESPDKCNEILQELNDKYMFDPQGSEELKNSIDECLPNKEN